MTDSATPAIFKSPAVIHGLSNATKLMSQRGISKDRKNENQGFKFRGIDDVYNELSPILVESNLVCVPRILSRDSQERISRKERNGNVVETALFFETVTIEYTVYSSIDGSSVQGIGIGQAMDSGDKALNKAQSAAFKYFWFQLLCIPTEGNNDADATTHDGIQPAASPVAIGVDEELAALKLCETYAQFEETWRGFSKPAREEIAVKHRDVLTSLKAKFGK